MTTLLRLQFVTLYRLGSRLAGRMLIPVAVVPFLMWASGHWKQGKAESIEVLGSFAGGLAALLLLALGFTLWSLESTIRCSPAGPRARFIAAAAFAAALAVPLGLFCLWIPGQTSPGDSGMRLPCAAMAAFLWGAFLVGSVAILARNGIVVVRAFALLAALAAGPIAVGMHVTYGVPGPTLLIHLLCLLGFGALYRRLEAELETQPGGSTMIRPSDVESSPTAAPSPILLPAPPGPVRGPSACAAYPPPSLLAPLAIGTRPEAVLLRCLFSKWYWWGYVAIALAYGVVGIPKLGIMMVSLFLYIGVSFPNHAWSGFQASPFSRRRAFLALYSPVFGLWLLVFGLQVGLGTVARDTRYVTWIEEHSMLDGVEVTHRVARLKVPDGWIVERNAKECISEWPGGSVLKAVEI